ncbi:MAG: T9SS type A sorting domain-containing protein, partial [Prevotella sp.]|nr:T9SS type A sorting domain-containing protein [Prevotella sp.]
NTANIYIRRKFTLAEVPSNVALKHWVYADANFYINGNKIAIKTNNNTYCFMTIDPSLLVQGENIIAVEATSPCSDNICQQFVDFGLFDTGKTAAETIVIGQSQPNFVIGPNGFERWMMYKAYFNASQQQGIDRMHFYDKELVVESSSSLHSSGYHPQPSLPAFINYFDHAIYYPYEFRNNSDWKITAGILRPADNSVSELLLLTEPMTHYRYEVPFRILPGAGDYAGVYACWQDENNYLKLKINRDNSSWSYELCEQGSVTNQTFGLPAKFEFLENNTLVASYEEPWHTLTVYKNGGDFKVELDYFNLTLDNTIHTGLTGSGKMGLLASSTGVSFDAVQFTGGFDEWDDKITGWEAESGTWNGSASGLQQSAAQGKAVALKGDKYRDYEFSAFLKNEQIPSAGKVGFYPLYVDENNYVEVGVNYATGQLEIASSRNGQVETQSVSLSSDISRQYTLSSYPTTSYRYDFRSETDVSGVNILWFEGNYPYLSQTFDLPGNVKFYALQDGRSWQQIDTRLDGGLQLAFFNLFTFDKVRTKAIRMDVTPQSGKACRAFSAYFKEDLAAAYFLRARRENDRLYLFVNDSLKATLEGDWDASCVGLFTENLAATFNGVLHYQGGKVAVSKINVEGASCAINQTVQMHAEVEPVNATNKQVFWESSNPQIASIGIDGKVTRHQAGSVTINAWAADGGLVKGSTVLGETSGVDAVVSGGISVYPNPAHGKLIIRSDEPVEKIELRSMLGKVISVIKQENNELNLSEVPAGAYFLNIRTANRNISNKIIKK